MKKAALQNDFLQDRNADPSHKLHLSGDEMNKNVIIEKAQPVMEYIIDQRRKFETAEVMPDVLRLELKKKLSDMETELLKFHQIHSRLDTIKYVLTALIDEIVIFSNWRYVDQWQINPLEMEIFGKNIAGERFFSLLEKEGYSDPEMAELFYLCLCLGFKRDEKKYWEYKQRLYALIPNRLPEDERRLAPGAEETIQRKLNQLPPLIGLMVLVIVIFVSAILYGVASQWLWNDAADLIHNISRLVSGNG